MKRRLIQMDSNTGEVLDGFVAFVTPKRRNGFVRWIAMNQDALGLLAKGNLKLEDHRVFLALLARLDFENMLVLNQAEVARELNMDRSQVNRAIKRLTSLGVLIAGPRVGVNRSYKLNPNFGWKGNARNHVINLADYRR